MPDLWSSYRYPKTEDFEKAVATGVPLERLHTLCAQLNFLPEKRTFFSKVYKFLEERKKMMDSGRADWDMAELMGYATLVTEGHPVRLSGQAAERGTFAHRHASYTGEDMNDRYMSSRR